MEICEISQISGFFKKSLIFLCIFFFSKIHNQKIFKLCKNHRKYPSNMKISYHILFQVENKTNLRVFKKIA
jgi:hypothetical protein